MNRLLSERIDGVQQRLLALETWATTENERNHDR
jgi:hypothetical protein